MHKAVGKSIEIIRIDYLINAMSVLLPKKLFFNAIMCLNLYNIVNGEIPCVTRVMRIHLRDLDDTRMIVTETSIFSNKFVLINVGNIASLIR